MTKINEEYLIEFLFLERYLVYETSGCWSISLWRRRFAERRANSRARIYGSCEAQHSLCMNCQMVFRNLARIRPKWWEGGRGGGHGSDVAIQRDQTCSVASFSYIPRRTWNSVYQVRDSLVPESYFHVQLH